MQGGKGKVQGKVKVQGKGNGKVQGEGGKRSVDSELMMVEEEGIVTIYLTILE